MKCALCNAKEFSVVVESHHPIEDQPVMICFQCFEVALVEIVLDYDEREMKIERHKQARLELHGKRC